VICCFKELLNINVVVVPILCKLSDGSKVLFKVGFDNKELSVACGMVGLVVREIIEFVKLFVATGLSTN
jgi:hypothetical protein